MNISPDYTIGHITFIFHLRRLNLPKVKLIGTTLIPNSFIRLHFITERSKLPVSLLIYY